MDLFSFYNFSVKDFGGVGFGDFDSSDPSYDIWSCMIRRVYQRVPRAYVGCSVSSNFKSFQYFAEWCHKQVGFCGEGMELDKDLLVKGNKVYHEDRCVFLPKELNMMFVSAKRVRGGLPIGVQQSGPNFRVRACLGDKRAVHLGSFKTVEAAFHCYKNAKEEFIKQQAEKFRSAISLDAYNALMAYEVEASD